MIDLNDSDAKEIKKALYQLSFKLGLMFGLGYICAEVLADLAVMVAKIGVEYLNNFFIMGRFIL